VRDPHGVLAGQDAAVVVAQRHDIGVRVPGMLVPRLAVPVGVRLVHSAELGPIEWMDSTTYRTDPSPKPPGIAR